MVCVFVARYQLICDFPRGVPANANETLISGNLIRLSDQGGILDEGEGTVSQDNTVR